MVILWSSLILLFLGNKNLVVDLISALVHFSHILSFRFHRYTLGLNAVVASWNPVPSSNGRGPLTPDELTRYPLSASPALLWLHHGRSTMTTDDEEKRKGQPRKTLPPIFHFERKAKPLETKGIEFQIYDPHHINFRLLEDFFLICCWDLFPNGGVRWCTCALFSVLLSLGEEMAFGTNHPWKNQQPDEWRMVRADRSDRPVVVDENKFILIGPHSAWGHLRNNILEFELDTQIELFVSPFSRITRPRQSLLLLKTWEMWFNVSYEY